MREIKFRGQLIDGEWVYGLLCKPTVGQYAGCAFISNSGGLPMAYEVRPETVGEYTGLTDKNGKKIYEGDILGKEEKAEVIFERGCFTVRGYPIGEWFGIMERRQIDYSVIDNAYENPELLK